MKNKKHPTAEKYKEILAHLGYSIQTQESYTKHVEDLILSSNENPYKLSKEYINFYLLKYEYSSRENQNQIISAIKIYCTEILKIKKLDFTGIKRPRKEHKLPNIIPEEYLKECLEGITNLKHKTILSLTYSLGLRRADIQNLKLSDLSSKNKQLKVVGGKGNKDAYLPLSDRILDLIIRYYRQYKPKAYLFEGQKDNLYSGTSLNNLVKKYVGKQYHFHELRHSFACHLLDKRVNIKFIQEMLRHEDIKTTMLYLKISTKQLEKLPIY